METAEFKQHLRSEGFIECGVKALEPGMIMAEHEHPFDVCGLVLDGEFALTVAGSETCYRAGEVFRMPADCPHSERTGTAGARYLVGRRLLGGET